MKSFEQYCAENNLDDLFGKPDPEILARIKARGKIVKKQRHSEPFPFMLYRGFDADLDSLEKIGENFVLSPKRSEQGMLWFTHIFANIRRWIDPAERGEWFLKYPLQGAIKHWDEVIYENGDSEKRSPDEMEDESRAMGNKRFACFTKFQDGEYCIELPEGWYFTYKNERYIATTNKITVHPSMITKNRGRPEDQ